MDNHTETAVSDLNSCLVHSAAACDKRLFLNPGNRAGFAVFKVGIGCLLANLSAGFTAGNHIPVLHGCTVGELAQMINGEGWLAGKRACKLTIIPMEGWKHGQAYSLPVKPSPNLPNDQSIALYASLCPFEGTAISGGRGTYTPFQIIGSPALPTYNYRFKPQSLEGFDKNPMYKDQHCYGKDLRHATPPQGFSLEFVIEFYKAYQKEGKAKQFFTRANWFDLLMGTSSVRLQIIAGKNEESIRSTWQADLKEYLQMRSKYLLYP